MVTGFSQKKIKTTQSLGDKFRQCRRRKKISLCQAEIETKVSAKYLEAIESGDWASLPQAVYVRGFVLSYARFLKLDKKEILFLYESESVMRQNESVFENKISYTQTYKDKKVLLTPKVLGYSTLGFFVLGMILYIAIQLAAFTGTPNLAIASPANNVIVDVDNIDLSGITDGDTIIKVNEEKVPVTSGGHFSLNLKLHQGVNVIQVQAINKLEKETSKVYTIEYRPKTAAISNIAEQ